MFITNNLDEDRLLFNQPITLQVWQDETKSFLLTSIELKPLNFRNWRFNNVVTLFMRIYTMDEDEYREHFNMFDKITNSFQFYYFSLKCYRTFLEDYIQNFIDFFNLLGINLEIEDNTYFINGIQLEYNLYEEIMNCVKISSCLTTGLATIKDKKYIELEKKINKIKKNSKTNIENNFEQSFIILSYEYNLKPEEILDMNIYQIKTLLSYSGAITNYKISLIATGNGLSKKKFQHYSEKRRK